MCTGLTHPVTQQRLTQRCKAIMLQLKKKKIKKLRCPGPLPRALEVRPSCTEQHRQARVLRAAVPRGAPQLPVFTCLPLPCFDLPTTPSCHVWMEAAGSLRGGGLTLTSGWTLAPDKLGPGCALYRRQENGTCPCPRVMMLQTSKETTPWARLHP